MPTTQTALNQRRLAIQTRMQLARSAAASLVAKSQDLVRSALPPLQFFDGVEFPVVALYPLQQQDGPALWDFETQHRDFFAHSPYARPSGFYTSDGFAQALQRDLQSQSASQSFHYVMRDGETVVGTVDLARVQSRTLKHAHLVCCMGPTAEGATPLHERAVQLVVDLAFYNHGLRHLLASTQHGEDDLVNALLHHGFVTPDFDMHAPSDMVCPTRPRPRHPRVPRRTGMVQHFVLQVPPPFEELLIAQP